MTHSALVLVDIQNGFVTEHSRHVIPKIKGLLDQWGSTKDVVFTRFINEDGSLFESIMNWTKLRNASEIEIVEELTTYSQRATAVIDKSMYSLFNEEGSRLAREREWREVYVCGIDTEVCVLKTAVDAFEAGIVPWLIADASYSHSGAASHEAGLAVAAKMIGRGQIIQSRDVVARAEPASLR